MESTINTESKSQQTDLYNHLKEAMQQEFPRLGALRKVPSAAQQTDQDFLGAKNLIQNLTH